VTAMLSEGTFGHGGAFGTQGWIDPKKDLFVILLIQRVGLPNADASDLRRELQTLAVGAIKPEPGRAKERCGLWYLPTVLQFTKTAWTIHTVSFLTINLLPRGGPL